MCFKRDALARLQFGELKAAKVFAVKEVIGAVFSGDETEATTRHDLLDDAVHESLHGFSAMKREDTHRV